MVDPDLQIKGRPDRPDPTIRGGGGGGDLENFFLSLWASIRSKNKGDLGRLGPSPRFATENLKFMFPSFAACLAAAAYPSTYFTLIHSDALLDPVVSL